MKPWLLQLFLLHVVPWQLFVKTETNSVCVLAQMYKCIKTKYLGDRASLVTSLGVLVARCEAVWFVEFLWEKKEDNGTICLKLLRCQVAPEFSAPLLPAGLLGKNLELQELEDRQGQVGLSDFMLWANHGEAAPPQGFRWLTQYSDRLAEIHSLPRTPLVLRLVDLQAAPLTLEDAVIIGQGHRSLVVRVKPDDDFVVKISSTANTDREHFTLAKAAGSMCPHLRKAIPGFRGVVEGAGEGLSFIGLNLYCSGSISMADVSADACKQKYMEQARNLFMNYLQKQPIYVVQGGP